MLKQVFDTTEQCGQPNPLLTLSRNLGQTNSSVQSAVEEAIQRLATSHESTGDLLTKEYMLNMTRRLIPSNTFNMREMLAQLPVNDQRQFAKRVMMEHDWTKAQSNSEMALCAQEFTTEYLKIQQQTQQWANQFAFIQQNAEKEKDCQNTSSVWAKDFLEQYDLFGQPTAINELDKSWEHEFLSNCPDQKQNHDKEEISFFDYESVWDAIHNKEAQQQYQFLEGNPFLSEENSLNLASESLKQGRLTDSILHYEAALHKNPKNSEIWYLLGSALAENEQDPRAISALRNALNLNPRNKNAILALAVSLTNESFDFLALRELGNWICVHQGKQLPENSDQNTKFFNQYKQLNRTEFLKVERQFLESAGLVQQVDKDLQNALSVLYNLGKDYDRAVDCLNAALIICPEDPVLWNRIGATLANADRSSEAINAYKRALHLSPCYVRARYNLGIACINLCSYRDAVSHFVAALQIQHSPDQSLIWSKLRSSLIRIENLQFGQEIMEALDKKDLNQILKHLQNL